MKRLCHAWFKMFLMYLRKKRLYMLIVSLSFALMSALMAKSLYEVYPDQSKRDALKETMTNPSITAMIGPASSGKYTIGNLFVHEMLMTTLIIIAILNVLMVVKDLKKDEENGFAELIHSRNVGRLAIVLGYSLYIVVYNLLLGALTTLAIQLMNVEGLDFEWNLFYGLSLALCGMFFAFLTACLSQVFKNSEQVIRWAIGLVIVFYLFRAITDIQNDDLSLWSPIGLLYQIFPYGENDLTPVLIISVLTLVLFGLTVLGRQTRDVGAAIFGEPKGRERAPRWLAHFPGLIVKQFGLTMIIWLVAMFVLGASYGSIFGDLKDFADDNPMIKQILGGGSTQEIIKNFIPFIAIVLTLISAIYPIILIQSLYRQEHKGQLTLVYITGKQRLRLFITTLLTSLILNALLIVMYALGIWLAQSFILDDSLDFDLFLKAGLNYYPITALFISVAACLLGLKPSLIKFIWAIHIFTFVASYLGELISVADWMEPFILTSYMSNYPVKDTFNVTESLVMIGIALALIVIGALVYKRRDLKA
ncbi:ABC transporter permease [Staphylococcus massiliensis]|uniref:Putative exporter of polyketide antibiotics-like protein n=1 Tax=Staphylococcus massiliensis S46 TaxID=1229783 RepID=K9B8E5_9STAP|nr:exporter of polyketide antibiotics-like protein [Staphylococcus massiliensis]EKU50015.1 putative exporter of polyketide antibiotics-like protein [Staphylococcus massiliensis S46]PNZ97697.1 polyketide antibiotic transporter [Staphylococcus massiliensis CCUG 55927]